MRNTSAVPSPWCMATGDASLRSRDRIGRGMPEAAKLGAGGARRSCGPRPCGRRRALPADASRDAAASAVPSLPFPLFPVLLRQSPLLSLQGFSRSGRSAAGASESTPLPSEVASRPRSPAIVAGGKQESAFDLIRHCFDTLPMLLRACLQNDNIFVLFPGVGGALRHRGGQEARECDGEIHLGAPCRHDQCSSRSAKSEPLSQRFKPWVPGPAMQRAS